MAIFLSAMSQGFVEYSPADLFNCDETSCAEVPKRLQTIANTGHEAVTIALNRPDPKEHTTLTATISVAGQKLRMCMICHGKTPRCKRRAEE
jgi:hypothetical protein